MKVWVLECGQYEDRAVVGVFADAQDAMKWHDASAHPEPTPPQGAWRRDERGRYQFVLAGFSGCDAGLTPHDVWMPLSSSTQAD